MPLKYNSQLRLFVVIILILFTKIVYSAETTNYSYDNMDRLTRVEYGDGTVVEFTYDKMGNRTQKMTILAGITPSPTTTPTPSTSSAPIGSIIINNGDAYTNSTAATLSLSATDDDGVTDYYLSTNSTPPLASSAGWMSFTSTTNYIGSVPYTLSSEDGKKILYAWYKDVQGNVSDTSSDAITLDTTSPTITITSPTSNSIYTSTHNDEIILSGNGADTTSGIRSVSWINDKGGSGTAHGTTNWTCDIKLTDSSNTITVKATDDANNTGTDLIKVYFGEDWICRDSGDCTDNYEPNNSFSTAYGPLTAGTSHNAKICCPSDRDYYTVKTVKAGILTITLDVPSNVDYSLSLFDASQNWLANSYMGTGQQDSISYTLQQQVLHIVFMWVVMVIAMI